MTTATKSFPQSAICNPQSIAAPEAQRLKIVFVGHVDHGKSTLIGRIFHDTDSLPDGKVEQIKKAAEAEGMEFEYAFLLDALLEEQEQNITIDTTQIQFRTEKRNYVIIDAPGHKEFLKNMITGAASADAAVLLIAANEGVQEQSRRHGYLLSLLGIKQVVVAVNKMDLVDYSEEVFDELSSNTSPSSNNSASKRSCSSRSPLATASMLRVKPETGNRMPERKTTPCRTEAFPVSALRFPVYSRGIPAPPFSKRSTSSRRR